MNPEMGSGWTEEPGHLRFDKIKQHFKTFEMLR